MSLVSFKLKKDKQFDLWSVAALTSWRQRWRRAAGSTRRLKHIIFSRRRLIFNRAWITDDDRVTHQRRHPSLIKDTLSTWKLLLIVLNSLDISMSVRINPQLLGVRSYGWSQLWFLRIWHEIVQRRKVETLTADVRAAVLLEVCRLESN